MSRFGVQNRERFVIKDPMLPVSDAVVRRAAMTLGFDIKNGTEGWGWDLS